MESISSDDARRSLDSIGASRHDVADRLTTPRWYHPVLGLLLAQMVLAYGLVGGLPAVLSALAVAVGAGWLVRAYAGRTGISVSRPTGLRSTLALAAFAVALVGQVLCVVLIDDPTPTLVVALAVSVLVCTLVLGPVYDAALRADLRAESRGVGRAAA
jgi:hypothetical protein